MSLNEADEHNFLVDLREDLDNQLNFFQVTFLVLGKKVSLDLNHIGFGGLEVPLDQLIVCLSYGPRDDLSDVSWYQLLTLEP